MAHDFRYYKDRINILSVLKELDYKQDPSKGQTTPCFRLTDNHGNETDKVYIKNPGKVGSQRFWRRTISQLGGGGDAIDLIKENMDILGGQHAAYGDSETTALNKVLAHFANVIYEEEDYKNHLGTRNEEGKNVFELQRYERIPGDIKVLTSFLAQRGMNARTAEMFRPAIESVHDTKSKFNYRNLAFPYTKAGTPYRADRPQDIVGYELRGYGGFKSKATGTNSTTACWQAYIGSKPGEPIRHIHFAEGAYDIMAYVQINKDLIDLDTTLFVSLGGSFPPEIVRTILDAYPDATPVLHFDNDMNGFLYDCRFACTMCGKNMTCHLEGDDIQFQVGERAFSIPQETATYNKFREGSGLRPVLKVEKAPKRFKDWNEILQKAMEAQPRKDKAVAMQTMKAKARNNTMASTDGTPGENYKTDNNEEETPRTGRKL